MDNKQIKEALQGIFAKEKHRIVFWYDGEQEFAEILPELGMYDADVLCLDEYSPLEVKIRLEIEDAEPGICYMHPIMSRQQKTTGWLISAFTAGLFMLTRPRLL
jgi:hypothetical protein